MVSKTEWPTAARLEQLRAQGKVAFSPTASGLLALAGVLAGFAFSSDNWQKIIEQWKGALAGPDLDLTKLSGLASPSMNLVLMPVLCAALAVLLGGLVQTKFSLHAQALQLDLAKLSVFSRFSLGSLLQRVVWGIVFTLIGLLSSYVLFRQNTLQILSLLNLSPELISNWFQRLFRDNLPLACAFLVSSALGVWFLARMRFMFNNRMTRAELEQEAREE